MTIRLSPGMDDEGDEILVRRPIPHSESTLLKKKSPKSAEEDYMILLQEIKTIYGHDMVTVYSSPEFKELRDKLKQLLGEEMANDIMNIYI